MKFCGYCGEKRPEKTSEEPEQVVENQVEPQPEIHHHVPEVVENQVPDTHHHQQESSPSPTVHNEPSPVVVSTHVVHEEPVNHEVKNPGILNNI
jgi:hypothetical protein